MFIYLVLGFSSFQSLDSRHFVQDLMVDGGEGSPKHPIHSFLGVIGRMLCVELVELVSLGVDCAMLWNSSNSKAVPSYGWWYT